MIWLVREGRRPRGPGGHRGGTLCASRITSRIGGVAAGTSAWMVALLDVIPTEITVSSLLW
jgi:hypothetical protein